MSSEEKYSYKLTMRYSLITIGIAIITLILTLVLYTVGGIDIDSFQILQLVMIILSGMILPGVIFILSNLEFKENPIAKNNPLLFGIVILAIGALVLVISVIWISYLVAFMPYFPEVLGLSIGILISIILAIMTTALCIYYGGIQPLLRYRAKK